MKPSKILIVLEMILLVSCLKKRSEQSIKTKANHEEGKVDLKTEESKVVKRSAEDTSSNSSPSQDHHLLMPDSPRSSSLSIMPFTRFNTFGFKTGEDLNEYMDKEIALENIEDLGVYDKDKDDVKLKLCLKGCGGPVLGHLNDLDNNCLRISDKKYAKLNDNEVTKLVDEIKQLPNWNKAKLMWIKEPEKCKCDQ